MKILVLNYEYPPLGGGAGAITRQISEGLAAKGHYVTVITSAFLGLPDFEENKSLRIFRVKAGRKKIFQSGPMQMLRWANETVSFFKKNFTKKDFDIVFANFAIPGGLAAKQIKKYAEIPYVIMSHGHDIPWFCKKEMWFFQALLYFKIKRICSNSELNFVQTIEMKSNIDKFLGAQNAKKNVIIPNGWDSVTKENYSEKYKIVTIVFSARFVKQKDPIGLLKALEILMLRGVPFKANLFGDGPLMKRMVKFVESKSLSNCVRFFGWTERKELEKEYSKSHVFVLPSFHEAMSVAVMDALACGMYVVATDTGQNRSIIFHGAIVEKNNQVQLANEIEKYYLEKFSSGNTNLPDLPEEIIESYSWENITRKYEQALLCIFSETAV